MKEMLRQVSLPAAHNLSLNYGEAAGQTIKHLHFWIIPRSDADKTAGKGLARLINDINQK